MEVWYDSAWNFVSSLSASQVHWEAALTIWVKPGIIPAAQKATMRPEQQMHTSTLSFQKSGQFCAVSVFCPQHRPKCRAPWGPHQWIVRVSTGRGNELNAISSHVHAACGGAVDDLVMFRIESCLLVFSG